MTDNERQTWQKLEEPGPEIERVRDADGDVWYRVSDMGWSMHPDDRHAQSWWSILAYAPLTDAT